MVLATGPTLHGSLSLWGPNSTTAMVLATGPTLHGSVSMRTKLYYCPWSLLQDQHYTGLCLYEDQHYMGLCLYEDQHYMGLCLYEDQTILLSMVLSTGPTLHGSLFLWRQTVAITQVISGIVWERSNCVHGSMVLRWQILVFVLRGSNLYTKNLVEPILYTGPWFYITINLYTGVQLIYTCIHWTTWFSEDLSWSIWFLDLALRGPIACYGSNTMWYTGPYNHWWSHSSFTSCHVYVFKPTQM